MDSFAFDQFRFSPEDGRLFRADGTGEARLRPQAGILLQYLLEHPQTVVGREALCRAIWGDAAVVDFEAGLAALLREVRQTLQKLGGDPQLIETVPRRGYRLQARVDRGSQPAGGERRGIGHAVWILIAVAVLAVAAFALIRWHDEALPTTPDGPHQLAILPLERFGEPGVAPKQAGILLADSVLAALWRAELEDLELIGRTGMLPYADRDDVVAAVAADLGVNLLMEGAIRAETGRWQVDLRLLAVPPGRVIWSQTLEGNEPELPIADIARMLVDRLHQDWPALREQLGTL